MRRIKFLTGVPEPKSLDWNDNDLLDDFLPAVRRFLEFAHGYESCAASQPILTPSHPKWRSIDIEISTKAEDSILVELLESEIQSQNRSTDEKSTDFLDHSFAIFEGLETSNRTHCHDNDNGASFEDSTLDSASLLTDDITSHSTNISDTTEVSTCASEHLIRLPSHITNLQAVPKASHIQSIQPQTMTINIVVGIISLAPLRTVLLRKSGRTMDILEMLVGDETNAAFSITFWLQPDSESGDSLRQRLISLRPQTILVVKNVALNVFKGKVYGQSLNRHITRIETIVEVLGRDGQVKWKSLDAYGEQLEKVKRVEKWVIEFLCAYDPPAEEGSWNGKRAKRCMDLSEKLPPDTQ